MVAFAIAGAALSCIAAERDPFAIDKLRPPTPSSFWKGPATACPATPVVPDPLRLADTVDLALCNNPSTRESWAAAKASAAAYGIANSAFLPNIDGSITLQRNEVRSAPGDAGYSSLNASLSFNYLLFDFGGRDAAAELARQSLFAADWAHNNTLQTILLNAVQAYYQLYATQEAVQSALAAEKYSLTSLEATRAVVRRQCNARRRSAGANSIFASAAQSYAKRRRRRQCARHRRILWDCLPIAS